MRVEKEDVHSSGGIKIEVDTDAVLSLLQDKIYSDKYIYIQEVACNGRDAIRKLQRMNEDLSAKQRSEEEEAVFQRIQKHLDDYVPTITISTTYENGGETTFTDNGCGMSRDVIEKVFRIYGRSDKHDDSNQTGGFGIGAKSPLAVVDVFTTKTKSIVDDKAYIITVGKREIIVEEIDGSTMDYGTTVTIPDHHRARLEKACDGFRWWDEKVVVDGAELKTPVHEIVRGKLVDLIVTESDYRSYMLVDGVAYPSIDRLPSSYLMNVKPEVLVLTATRESIEAEQPRKRELLREVNELAKTYAKEFMERALVDVNAAILLASARMSLGDVPGNKVVTYHDLLQAHFPESFQEQWDAPLDADLSEEQLELLERIMKCPFTAIEGRSMSWKRAREVGRDALRKGQRRLPKDRFASAIEAGVVGYMVETPHGRGCNLRSWVGELKPEERSRAATRFDCVVTTRKGRIEEAKIDTDTVLDDDGPWLMYLPANVTQVRKLGRESEHDGLH